MVMDHLHPVGSGDLSTMPNTVISQHISPESSGFVIISGGGRGLSQNCKKKLSHLIIVNVLAIYKYFWDHITDFPWRPHLYFIFH